jgi:chromosome segregation protein
VTSGGEVIEPSGIVSGGSFKLQKQYPQLETDLNKLNSMKTLTVQEIRNHNDALRQVASENSKKETEKLDVSIELKHLQSKIEELSHEQDELSATYKAKTIEYEKLAEASQSIADKRINIESNLKLMKENAMRIYSGIGNIVSNADEEKDAEMQEKLLAELQDMKMQVASLVKENEMYGTRAKQVDKEIQEASKNLHEIKIQLSKLKSDQASLIPQLAEMESKLKLKDKASAELFEQINEKDALISKVGIEKGKLQSNIERLSKENSEIDLNRQHTQIRLNDIKSELNILSTEDILKALSNVTGKQDVSLDIIRMEFLKKHFGINSQQELEIELSSVKKELEKINDVNLKAPEMFAQRQKDLNEIEQKLSTLKKEKDAVIEMINEIEGRKISIFNTVFESVNSNMKKLFSYVNTTEEVNLRIEKPSDPFNSGLFIETSKIGAKRPPKSIETLSGGEKALLLIILLLSIQIRNSLSFYLFDEIDVSLDKENSKKLSKIIKELSKSSQFIVVSHNDSLITEADIAIGVSKQNDESKAFGLQLSELRQQALAKSK